MAMQNNERPFTQYDQTIIPTQSDNSDYAQDAPIQDNGTEHANFSAGGMRTVSKVNYPLPPDPNAPHGDDGDNDLANPMEMGVDESKEVGHNGGVNCYGIDGPAAGGGNKRNTRG